jgi:hypothetical protein
MIAAGRSESSEQQGCRIKLGGRRRASEGSVHARRSPLDLKADKKCFQRAIVDAVECTQHFLSFWLILFVRETLRAIKAFKIEDLLVFGD